MWKFEFRKLAVVTLALAVGFMAACSSSSSSNDALSHPGDGYLGTIQVDVDPAGNTVDIAPVGNAFSSTPIPGDGSGNIPNVVVTSSNATWDAVDTMDVDITVGWTAAASNMFNVRLSVVSSNDTAVTANAADIGDGIVWSDPGLRTGGGAGEVAYTYVADSAADGPETYTTCNALTTCVSDTAYTYIHEDCGSVTTHFSLTSGGAQYQFFMDLWGDIVPEVPLTSDPNYDVDTGSIYLKTFNLDPADSTFPVENTETAQFASGEWFYAHYYVDAPGANRPIPFTSDATAGPKSIEDTGNLAAYSSGLSSFANYWFVGRLNTWSIRWDPATININANDEGLNNKFTTSNGTVIFVVDDVNLVTDGFNIRTAASTSSNSMAIFLGDTGKGAFQTGRYGNPGQGSDGFAGIDWDVGKLALQAIGPAGSGSPIKIAYSSHTLLVAYRSESTPYTSGDDFGAFVPRSTNYPDWCEITVNGGCVTGQYNAERHAICIQ